MLSLRELMVILTTLTAASVQVSPFKCSVAAGGSGLQCEVARVWRVHVGLQASLHHGAGDGMAARLMLSHLQVRPLPLLALCLGSVCLTNSSERGKHGGHRGSWRL